MYIADYTLKRNVDRQMDQWLFIYKAKMLSVCLFVYLIPFEFTHSSCHLLHTLKQILHQTKTSKVAFKES